MPSTLLKACSHTGCPELTEGGPCPAHARAREQRRGSSASRGYDSAWRAFRTWFFNALISHNILPACGARWPGVPATTHSRCVIAGRITTDDLHLDHEPPLTDAERADSRKVCDRRRVQLLCESCHSAKTQREQQEGRV